MKKFWIVLLALGLVAGFAMSASAADVKFSGSYYVSGIYIDNPQFLKKDVRTYGAQAFYQNRLRIQTEFKVAEGLMLVTRFDALEKAWGYAGSSAGNLDAWRWGSALGAAVDTVNRPSSGDVGNTKGSGAARTQENIEFERAYMDFTTKIGRFQVGYQDVLTWGTSFLNTSTTRPAIKYMVPIGPLTFVAMIEKAGEMNAGTSFQTDADYNIYDLAVVYKFGAGDAGLMYQYGDRRIARSTGAASAQVKLNVIQPYAKMKFGPVYVEAEGVYGFGDALKYDGAPPAGSSNMSGEAMGLYLGVKADIGPAYVGGVFAWMRGDDPATSDKQEGGFATGLLAGQAWNPTLILWNDDIYGSQHRIVGAMPTASFFDNAWLYQIYAGFKPVKEADIMLKLSYANVDKKPTGVLNDSIGTEIDLIAKYKLFDNLEYMMGLGYLFAGDYFKGISPTTQVDNNYILFHKLTLSF